MNGSVLKNKVFNFIEISFSLFVFVFIFYILSNYSSILFLKISSKNGQEAYLSNQRQIASLINSRDDSFWDSMDSSIKIAFVGDIMLDRGVKQKVEKEGGGDYNFVFAAIRRDLERYDFIIGNLEGPVSNIGIDKKNLYSFRMNPKIISVMKEVGFTTVSVANNHMGDWGIEAMEDTFYNLEKGGIKVIGGGNNLDDAIKPKILEKNGVSIAILAFSQFGNRDYGATDENPGIAIISETNLRKGIDLVRENSDIVVVNFHFGDEYQEKQNSYQEKYAKMAIDFGADLVVGHHPHVVQPVEQYKNTYIAYSLGNFVFDQYFSLETMEGGLLEVIIEDKKISSVKMKKINMNDNYQPSLIE